MKVPDAAVDENTFGISAFCAEQSSFCDPVELAIFSHTAVFSNSPISLDHTFEARRDSRLLGD